jgi:hypothetical protein
MAASSAGRGRPRNTPALAATDDKELEKAAQEKTAEATGGNAGDTSTEDDKSAELDEAQRQIAELKDQLAKAKGANDPDLEHDKVANPGDEKNILIHFVRDGFCDLGAIWYKGQELELEPGTPQYDSAKSWANYTPEQQEEFYGEVYFRQGPWKGKDYEDEAAAKAERRRGRAAPRVAAE